MFTQIFVAYIVILLLLSHFQYFLKDLEASVKHLHHQGISNPNTTVVSGRSAGGLAVAVLANEMPHLFKAAVLQVFELFT